MEYGAQSHVFTLSQNSSNQSVSNAAQLPLLRPGQFSSEFYQNPPHIIRDISHILNEDSDVQNTAVYNYQEMQVARTSPSKHVSTNRDTLEPTSINCSQHYCDTDEQINRQEMVGLEANDLMHGSSATTSIFHDYTCTCTLQLLKVGQLSSQHPLPFCSMFQHPFGERIVYLDWVKYLGGMFNGLTVKQIRELRRSCRKTFNKVNYQKRRVQVRQIRTILKLGVSCLPYLVFTDLQLYKYLKIDGITSSSSIWDVLITKEALSELKQLDFMLRIVLDNIILLRDSGPLSNKPLDVYTQTRFRVHGLPDVKKEPSGRLYTVYKSGQITYEHTKSVHQQTIANIDREVSFHHPLDCALKNEHYGTGDYHHTIPPQKEIKD